MGTVKSRPGFFFFSILFTKLLNKPGTSRIPFPTRWQAANARPAVVATVAMESVDALPAVASEQRQPNLRLSLAPKSRGGRSSRGNARARPFREARVDCG